MSKRGKQARALRKKQQKLQKILKRLQQAGVILDTDYVQETETKTKKPTTLKRRTNHDIKDGTNSKTNNLIPTNQNTHRSVQASSTDSLPKPSKPHEVRINTDGSFFASSIINSWLDEIHHFPRMAEPILKQWYNSLLERYTKDDIAMMLEEGARAGVVLTYEIAYDGEKLAMYMSDMLDFYPEMTPWEKAEVMEQFESWEDIL